MSGYYLMHRDWQDNPLFGREAFSRRDAWVWLIEQASFASKSVSIGGKTVHLQRGQLSSSLRYMAKAWGWDEAKVRRFLSRAKSENMIDAATDAGQTVITICNYDRYQSFDKQTDAPGDAETTQERRGADAKYKEGKKGKEDTSEAKASSVAHPTREKALSSRLPINFEPVLTPDAQSLVDSWPPGMFEREMAQWRDHHTAKGTTAKDWQASLRTWLRRADEYRAERNGRQLQPANALGRSRSDASGADLLAALQARRQARAN